MDNYINPNQNPNSNLNQDPNQNTYPNNNLNTNITEQNNGYLNQAQGYNNPQATYQPQYDYNSRDNYQNPNQNPNAFQPANDYQDVNNYQQANGYQGGYMNDYQNIVPPQQQVPVQFIEWQMDQEEKHKASILCTISLLCHFVVPIISMVILGLVNGVFGSGDITSSVEDIEEFSATVMTMFSGAAYIASWVLMIIARVKYKHSVFAKVVMWIYIGLLILSIIGVIILIMACINMIRQCPG